MVSSSGEPMRSFSGPKPSQLALTPVANPTHVATRPSPSPSPLPGVAREVIECPAHI
jgi:hypothetical protein